jgi:hypothetical protein
VVAMRGPHLSAIVHDHLRHKASCLAFRGGSGHVPPLHSPSWMIIAPQTSATWGQDASWGEVARSRLLVAPTGADSGLGRPPAGFEPLQAAWLDGCHTPEAPCSLHLQGP